MEGLTAVWLFIVGLVAPPAAVIAGALWLLVPRPGRRVVAKAGAASALPIPH